MEHPTYKLNCGDVSSLSDLNQKVDQGYRFIVFSYTISILFAISLRRFSDAYLVKPDGIMQLAWKYNMRSKIWGWWCIPWGPHYTLKSIRTNKTGGIDVTEDVLLNLDQESLENRSVEIKETLSWFCEPNPSNLKGFDKTLRKDFERYTDIKEIVVGWYINTDKPHYVVGINHHSSFDRGVELVSESLYSYFTRHTTFSFIDLSKESLDADLLRKQGTTIVQRNQ